MGIAAALFCLISQTSAETGCSEKDLNGEGYVSVNGARLFYKAIGTGEPILILHGGPGLDHTYFLPQMASLSTTHRFILFDQRASG